MKINLAKSFRMHRSATLLRSLQIAAVAALLLLISSWQAAAQTWIQESPTGTPPTARADSGRAYDAIHDRLILFGGWGQTGRPIDVWVLSNATGAGGTPNWEQLYPTGGPPHDREGHTVVYDPTSNRIIVYSGCFATCGYAMWDVWVLTNANGLGGTPEWIQLPDAPVGRSFHSAVYDPVSNRMIVFGGGLAFYNTDQNDVWVLVDANGIGSPHWEQLSPTGTAPAPRESSAAFYDQASNRMIISGGGQFLSQYCCSTMFDDVWALTEANGVGGTPQWIQLTPTGTPPQARFFHSAHYDPATRRMTIFGGVFDQRPAESTWLNDVWTLTEATGVNGTPQWIQLTPTGGPMPPRANYSGGYSPTANRMVVAMGRYDLATPAVFNDVWVLTNANGIIEVPQLTAAGPARIWLGLKNSDDVGTKFDLLAEVLKNGSVVGSGQLNNVPGGSSGFNNAVLRTIDLALSSPVNVSTGDTLSIRLSVRIAVGVTGHRSGTARLWFNDTAANSRFGATIGGTTNDYFLLNGSALDTAAGSGPKKTIDVFVDRLVGGNPFKPFGTWSTTF